MWRLIATVGMVAAAVAAPRPAFDLAANDVGPGYASVTSASDTVRAKSATVTCPAGTAAFGAGGHVNGGDGSVVLTAIVPAADLSGVSVSGLARPGFAGAWSVTAIAVCAWLGSSAPKRVDGATEQSIATARCPTSRVLYATGFAIVEPAGGGYVDAVVPAPDLGAVTVHGSVPGAGSVSLVAYGICGAPLPMAERTSAMSDTDGGTARMVVAPRPAMHFDLGSAMFGAGAVVVGEGAFLDGFGPVAGLDGAFAHGVAARDSPAGAGVRTGGEEGWGVNAYGLYIGSWY